MTRGGFRGPISSVHVCYCTTILLSL